MAIKTIFQNPSISDQVIIPILTPGADGCFRADPYMVNKVTIYYLETDFTSGGTTALIDTSVQQTLLDQLAAAKQAVCVDPSPENILVLQTAQQAVDNTGQTTTLYYTQATPAKIIGTPVFPAWLSTDQANAFLIHNTQDANGNTLYGNFQYDWRPYQDGVREGNYVVCWTWTPFAAGSTLSASLRFALTGDTSATTAIPTHQTMPGKYQTLLERYTPELYKLKLGMPDVTPSVLTRFNLALANGFTLIENLANQIIDLLDANCTPEAMLPLLSDFFNLKLKTTDPTLWRRQIKTAIPYFKRKGTLEGLSEALDAAGIKLNKLTRLWQIISRHTWVDDFLIDNPPQSQFILSRPALPVDPLNFELALRPAGSSDYEILDPSYVSFSDQPGQTTMNWLGNTNPTPIVLSPGDRLKVLYEYRPIVNMFEQQVENYIRTLPLADQRDENNQDFPLKNWNVRVLEEDDPLFDIVVPTRYPFRNLLIFGKIRSEFPYSENMYDSDEYNGGKYDSTNPCDIDKDFLDPCTLCQGSKFTVDIEISNLTNDRLVEAQEVINEFSPFHAVLQAMHISGGMADYIQSPVEDIEVLMQYSGNEVVLGGMGQMVFNRARFYGLTLDVITREMLATSITVVPSDTGLGQNTGIFLFGQNVVFDNLGINTAEAVLEIMAPSPHAGQYSVGTPGLHTIPVLGITEPLNISSFTFRLSNNFYQNSTTSIFQDNVFTFADANVNFDTKGVMTQFDVDHNNYTGGVWSVKIPVYSATPFPILNVLPDGTLLLNGSGGGLPSMNISSVNYILLDGNGNSILTSITGSLFVQQRGRVVVIDPNFTNIDGYLLLGYWVLYAGQQYEMIGYVPNQPMQFYIGGYSGGNVGGVSINVYQRLLDNEVGNLGYGGLQLTTSTNYELVLDIQNGDNPPAQPLENNSFKENFLVQIGSDYYAISEINGQVMTLSGPLQSWTLGGTPVSFSIIRYIKVPATISNSVTDPYFDDENNQTFTQVDRRGYEFITNDLNTAVIGNAFWMTMLNMPKKPDGNEMEEMVEQKEGISFKIEYKDGTVEERGIS
jgi:hypothetical protein